jgi:transcriptional regulator with XRE-family HTH domain
MDVNQIKVFIKKKGITQKSIAKRLRLKEPTFSKYLDGSRKMPERVYKKVIALLEKEYNFFCQ